MSEFFIFIHVLVIVIIPRSTHRRCKVDVQNVMTGERGCSSKKQQEAARSCKKNELSLYNTNNCSTICTSFRVATVTDLKSEILDIGKFIDIQFCQFSIPT